MTNDQSYKEAVERLTKFANGERMQDVWTGSYPPDGIRADLTLILSASEVSTQTLDEMWEG